MVEGSAECTAHLLPIPSYTSPHDGVEEQGKRGRGGAGWLSGGQVTTSCSEESKLPTEMYTKVHIRVLHLTAHELLFS